MTKQDIYPQDITLENMIYKAKKGAFYKKDKMRVIFTR